MSKYYYIEKTYLYVGFDYDKETIGFLKARGFLYNPETKEWYKEVSLDYGGSLDHYFKSHGFTFGRVQKKLLPPKLLPIKEIVSMEELKELIGELHLKREPRHYQLEGIHYMINHPNSINGCGPGLGKTMMSIVMVEVLRLFPCLIVTPAAVKYGWVDEWKKWVAEERRIQVVESKKPWLPDQDIYIINYDILWAKDEEKKSVIRFEELTSTNWQVIICDEIHFCKNDKSIRSKALKKIVAGTDLVFGLSGTVVMNRPAELINVLNLTGWFKKLFKDWQSYVYRYCNAKRRVLRGQFYGWDTTCASNTLELNDIISHYCYFRKEKRAVLPELPPLVEKVVKVDITNKREYEKAERDVISYLEAKDVEKVDAAINAENLVKLNILKELSLKGKMKNIEVFLKEWSETVEDKLLVFGVRRVPLKELAQKFNGLLIQGGISSKEKHDIVKRFQTSKDQFLFANIDAVGTGVDGLQECCSNLVYIELPDKFTTLEQTNARLERIGQRDSINVFYLLCPSTIDCYISEMLENKKKITDAINKGLDSIDMLTQFNLLHKLKRQEHEIG